MPQKQRGEQPGGKRWHTRSRGLTENLPEPAVNEIRRGNL